ncbi:MAG: hypothetical protein MJ197_06135 [Bacteroidales bacterium]|nr:hypothetical protein [Bacteroidales bacterium]
MRIVCGILLCLVMTLNSVAQTVSIEASVDTAQMRIGEQRSLTLSIEYGKQNTLVLPQFGKELSKNIVVVEPFTFDTLQANDKDKRKLQTNIDITCFDEGEYSFVIGPFLYGNDTVWSNPVQLSVQTVVIDSSTTLQPLKPIQVPQYSFRDYLSKILLTIALLLVVGLIIFMAWYFWKKRDKKSFFVTKEFREQADVKALRELEELKSLNLCEKEEFKSFYTELTNILRAYFGEVLDIDTFEKTSDELIQEIMTSGKVPLSVIQNLQIVLKEADFVKFAKHKPTVETSNLHYGLSLFCVNESKYLIHRLTETEEK